MESLVLRALVKRGPVDGNEDPFRGLRRRLGAVRARRLGLHVVGQASLPVLQAAGQRLRVLGAGHAQNHRHDPRMGHVCWGLGRF